MDQKDKIQQDVNQPITRREAVLIAIVIIISILGPFTVDSYIPSLPSMTHYFKTTPQILQWTIGVYLFSYAIAQIVFGPFSDRLGRRPVILYGIGITLVGSFLCMYAPHIPMLLLGRFIQGIGVAACNPLVKSIMRDIFSGIRLAKINSYTNMIFAIVPAIAPVVGGFVQHYFGWRANFAVITLLVIAVGIIAYFVLPETNQYRDPMATQLPTVQRNYFLLLKSRIFVGYSLCTGLASSGIIAYATIAPFLLQVHMNVSSREFGLLSTVIAVGFVIGNYINVRFIHHYGIHSTMMIGMVIMVLSGLVMLVCGLLSIINVPLVMVPTLTFVIGARFIFSNSAAAAFTPFPKIAGVASAVYGTIQILCSCATSFFVSGFHPGTPVPYATVLVGIGILSLLVLKFWIVPAESQNAQHLGH